jgi:hypothetical protein
LLLVLALPTFAGCASPGKSYVAPAPEGALGCALRTTAGLGYIPIAGGVGDGYIKVARKIEYRASDAAQEVGMRVMTLGMKGVNRTEYDHLTVTGAGETLRITAIGVGENGKATDPRPMTEGHVQAIISACGLPATDRVGQ